MMRPTNLLFILSDEHNRDMLGCYGHPMVQTPNLDRLAENGVRFDAAYTNCPICVPARASLATGQYVHQIRYWDNAFPYEGRVPGWGHRLIDEGHRVESIGKLHYRADEDKDGFGKHIIPLNVVGGIGDPLGSIRENPRQRTGTREGVTGAGPGESTYLQYDRDIAEQSCQWLRYVAENPEEKPWVLFSSFVCPHPPFIAPQELYDLYPLDQIPLPQQNRRPDWPNHPSLDALRQTMQYDGEFTEEQVRNVTAAYYGACTHLDQQIGRVLEVLEETGLAENTRIIYTSDHGESMGRRGLWGKFTLYEESAAVPFIMSGPDVPQGEVSKDGVSLVDCYQTILDCVGVEPNADESELPGASLWPIANGEAQNRPVFSEYHAVGSTTGWFMLRDGKYKYIHYVDNPPQLFDLEADPQELVNLAENLDFAETLKELDAKLREICDPEAADKLAKEDQHALIESMGGRDAVFKRGTFVNSPVPGEAPAFTAQSS
ncbi:MAG: sulfatase [Planctomycetaceae bacterium]|nr:sulfatase [Planctomycetaceae bacterium]